MNPNRARRRDRRRERRRISAPRHLNAFLRSIVGPPLRWLFRIETSNGELVRRLKPPYVLIANHACFLDPFMLNCQVPAPIHFVVSDSNFRSRLVDFGLSLVGSIPKTKAVSDLETVKNIVKIKAARGIIGLYPEGQNTWDGHTLPIVPATAKLLKSLKVPVVAARVQGAFLSMPRWARSFRRGKIVIRFEQIFTSRELKDSSLDQVYDRIVSALDHDEAEWQRMNRIPFRGANRAEYLEIILCVCPHCRSISSLHSSGDRLTCQHCGLQVRFDPQGFFLPDSNHQLYHDSIRSWNLWQTAHLQAELERLARSGSTTPMFEEPRVVVKTGYKSKPLEPLAIGKLQLHADHLTVVPETGAEPIHFPLRRVEGINVQNSEHLEFYLDGALYKITIDNRRGNAYKWILAVKVIKSMTNAVGD